MRAGVLVVLGALLPVLVLPVLSRSRAPARTHNLAAPTRFPPQISPIRAHHQQPAPARAGTKRPALERNGVANTAPPAPPAPLVLHSSTYTSLTATHSLHLRASYRYASLTVTQP